MRVPSTATRLVYSYICIYTYSICDGFYMSNEKRAPWLFRVYIGDEILPSYVGSIINR